MFLQILLILLDVVQLMERKCQKNLGKIKEMIYQM